MKGGRYIHAPVTFAERGAAAPFTTPLLWLTRVRPGDRSGLEILIPGFADGRGVYVVPWRAAPEMVAMTVHDRFLHAAIEAAGGVAPRDVRLAGLKAARNGLAGPAAAKAARAALAQDEEHKTVTHFLLLIELMRAAGLESAQTLRQAFGTAEGDAAVRRFTAAVTQRLQITPGTLDARLAEVAAAMCPVGLAFAPEQGRLRRRLSELTAFADSLEAWAADDGSDAAPAARFCVGTARRTLALGAVLLADFDRRACGVGAVIRDWSGQRGEIAAVADRLEWLTDGWDLVAAAWREALKGDAAERREAVGDILRVLPLVPRNEAAADVGEVVAADGVAGGRVGADGGQRAAALDFDRVRRIEAAKAAAA